MPDHLDFSYRVSKDDIDDIKEHLKRIEDMLIGQFDRRPVVKPSRRGIGCN